MITNNSLNNIFTPQTVINKNLGSAGIKNVLGKVYLQSIKESYDNKYVIRNLARIQDKDRITTLGKGYGTLYDYSIF